jgi:predicted unusual protein kinase regulating ubiquinone biosynthesis (AarF/ABC1/UbiB family)
MVATVDSLVDQLSQMRGAAMKFGQALSTVELPGLEPEQSEYLRGRLASLRDDVPAVEWEQMERVMSEEWGEKPERVLEAIEREPAAAASIGQVYRARTGDGREVAVKVQYPGIAEAVETDMRNLRMLSPVMRRLMPGLDVKEVLAELAERITEECDYELEAGHHRRIARFWREHPFIRVPDVDTELSRRRVLVTDWVDGMSFDAVAEQPDAVRDRFGEIVYRFFYANALELGIALGDPHPGNYLLCVDDRVAFFDFGMVRRLPPEYLRREASIFEAVRNGETEALMDGLSDLGYLPGARSSWDPELLMEHMRQISWWLEADGPVRLAPEDVWRASERLREPGGGELVEQMRRMTLPPEALLLRRMEGLLFQFVSTLRAQAPWGALFRELVEGAEPATELGAQHAAWLLSQH